MKKGFKKTVSLLLSSLLLAGAISFSAGAAQVKTDDAVGYGNQRFLETYATAAYNEKNLGSTYTPSSTLFKTWSPEATAVKVKLYNTGSDSESGSGSAGTYAMRKNNTTGVWSCTIPGDLKNQYYTYLVTVNGTTRETQDIYAKAAGVNGRRSMIVDLDSTDPDGWENDRHVVFQNAGEAVVWEVHVRDFSAHENAGVSAKNKGRYLAFAEGGTTLNGEADEISTCVDYLVEAGVNCVQLQPVFDFASVDESIPSSTTNRNWGYDPVNYNVPEGSYSSNPYDGNVRITEFKQMIQALHDRGISVIMDVVYNHTSSTDSCFERTAPGYYYRMNGSSFTNGSGCGNETASDKLMFRKFMIESTEYWANEYHIDGFRFDLMGLHDVTTMNRIRSNLDANAENGTKLLMYGEPWTGSFDQPIFNNPCLGWNGSISQLDSRVGMFNDNYRDAIKGDTDGSGKGFVQGNTSANTGTIAAGVRGKNGNYSGAQAPSQLIAYADAHDNLILWDKIVKSNGSSTYTTTSESYQKQVKEVMTLLMTSQGIPFMTAGSEFGRTKLGNNNSYNANDTVNAIDWERVKTLSGLADYYKGMLQIRKHYSPLHRSGFVAPTYQSDYGNVIAYTYTNNTPGEWNKLAVLVNGGTQAYTINLSGSNWKIVASTELGAGLESLGTVSGSSVSVPAKGSLVLVDSASFGNLQVNEGFGSLTVDHVDNNGNTLLTQTAKYRAGSTFRAVPDKDILYDHDLTGTTGATTGTVQTNAEHAVTFTYKDASASYGNLTVSYVDQNNRTIKASVSKRYRVGDSYAVTAPTIQGYQLDSSQFPAESRGVFTGSRTVKLVYKPIDSGTTTIHYKNANNWSTVRCYAYYNYGSGTQTPNGSWNSAGVMTPDEDNEGWYTCTVNAPMVNVIFHNGSGSQEPASGSDGYLAYGEIWIDGGNTAFKTTVVASHIDLVSGSRIAPDVITEIDSATEASTYLTSPLSGRVDAIVPPNASGFCQAGVINVVYLYTGNFLFTNNANWQNCYLYAFDGSGDIGSAWPGTKLTETTVNDMGEQQCIVHVPYGATGIVLHNGVGDQTVNITDFNVTGYYTTGERLANNQMQVASWTVEPEPVTEPPTEEPSEPTEYPGGTLLFTNTPDWSSCYVYAFKENSAIGAAWPGAKVTATTVNDYGQSQFIVSIPAGAEGIVLNNGSNEQTVDIIDFSVTGYYTLGDTDGSGHLQVYSWTDEPQPVTEPSEPSTEAPTTEPATESPSGFLFTNTPGWSSCYVYAFNDSGFIGAAWPGTKITETTHNDYGQLQYIVSVPAGATGIVLSNGNGAQTVDITDFNVTGYYTKGDKDGYGNLNVYSWTDTPSYADGDVNRDGIVSIADVTAVQKYLVELLALDQAQLLLADVNHDGEVSIADATLIQMIIAN